MSEDLTAAAALASTPGAISDPIDTIGTLDQEASTTQPHAQEPGVDEGQAQASVDDEQQRQDASAAERQAEERAVEAQERAVDARRLARELRDQARISQAIKNFPNTPDMARVAPDVVDALIGRSTVTRWRLIRKGKLPQPGADGCFTAGALRVALAALGQS